MHLHKNDYIGGGNIDSTGVKKSASFCVCCGASCGHLSLKVLFLLLLGTFCHVA